MSLGNLKRLPGVAFSWESQYEQYPKRSSPGIKYFAGHMEQGTVDCLLYYDDNGRLRGILNHYPFTYLPYEVEGNVNIWVDPKYQRRGVATALLTEAMKRWEFRPQQQSYTEAGEAFIRAFWGEKGES